MTPPPAEAGAVPESGLRRFALPALTLASFAIGSGEFVIVGLVPDLAADLHVSVVAAGMLVSAYALSVAFGSPFLAAVLLGCGRRTALVILMGVFVVGNVACALAPTYGLALAARIGTAVSHGAFFGIGAVVAAQIAPPGRSARAVAFLFTGLTMANVIGVPGGTWLGQIAGWRSTFLVVAGAGALSLLAIALCVPRDLAVETAGLRGELASLGTREVWLAMLVSMISSAALFSVLTYLTPLLEMVTGLSPHGAAFSLLLFGIGLTMGGLLGGRLADARSMTVLRGLLVLDCGVLAVFAYTSHRAWPAMFTVLAWGVIAFALVPPLQTRVVQHASRAPGLASTLNQSAFNLGDAAGAFLGGQVLVHTGSYLALPWLGALLASAALVPALVRERPST